MPIKPPHHSIPALLENSEPSSQLTEGALPHGPVLRAHKCERLPASPDNLREGTGGNEPLIPFGLRAEWRRLETRRSFFGRMGKALGWAGLASLLGNKLRAGTADAPGAPGLAFAPPTTDQPGAMHWPKYGLFYDLHTMPACPDVGENFDAEAFTDRLKRCGVDLLTFHARDNLGMAYYDTTIGIKHPSLKYDLFGTLAGACHRKGIAINAYLNGGISSAEGVLHREWTTLYFDGREYRDPRFTPFVRTMCYNSPYRDHLIAMVEEVAKKYPVSGFFIDCMNSYPCVCPICIEEMKKSGIDSKDLDAVTRFSESSAVRLSRDIAKSVNAIKPSLLLYFNGLGFEEQSGVGTYLECECVTAKPEIGYEYLPVLSHYMRTLGEQPIMNLITRFYLWGDFGGLRPEAALRYELLYGLANGLRPNIGSHFHPRGDLEVAVLDQDERIYKGLQAMEPWFSRAKNITEIAIVYPRPMASIKFDKQLRGAARMLEELKQQYDIVTHASEWSRYKVLVIPDDVTFDDETSRRVKLHLAAGRAVIASGSSGLDGTKTGFVFGNEWGVRFERECKYDPAYLAVDDSFRRGLPAMPLAQYASGVELAALPGTRIGARLVKPYFNERWDGEYAYFYNPPDKITDMPALTICGKVAHFSHRIFSGYNLKAPVQLRQLFANVLDELLPGPLLKTEGLPSFGRAFVTGQMARRIVHILTYVPELRGETVQMIEEPIEVQEVRIALRIGNTPPNRVYLAPNTAAHPFDVSGGYIRVTIPTSSGYSMVVFDE